VVEFCGRIEVAAMARKLAPCGTEAAYKRHLRKGEAPCDECTVAHRLYRRDQRRKPLPPEILAPVDDIEEPEESDDDGEELSREQDLLAMRKILMKSLDRAAEIELRAVAGLSKELRELWKEYDGLTEAEEDDPLARFNDDESGGGLAIVAVS
jgi:hypothetical protein